MTEVCEEEELGYWILFQVEGYLKEELYILRRNLECFWFFSLLTFSTLTCPIAFIPSSDPRMIDSLPFCFISE